MAHHRLDAFDWGDLAAPTRRAATGATRVAVPSIGATSRRSSNRTPPTCVGAVLEVQEDDFTRLAGGPRVGSAAVLDIDAANPRATVIADLRCAPELRSDAFDCVILTQTMHVIDDMAAVAREVHRVFRPGGVVLATLPVVSRVCLKFTARAAICGASPRMARARFSSRPLARPWTVTSSATS